MAKKRVPFSEQIRRAMAGSGVSRYRIAKETGISQAALSRFAAGKTGISTEYLDRVADLLGLQVITRKER